MSGTITLKSPRWEIKNVEAVFFDKDGTLIDSHLYWGRIIEKRSRALIKNSNLDDSYHEALCNLMGFSLNKRKLLPDGPIALVSREEVINIVYRYFIKNNFKTSEQEITDIFSDVHSDFINEIYDYIKILPNVSEILTLLKKREIKTAIITTDSVNNTKKIMEFLGLEPYFDMLVGKETCPFPKISGIPAIMAINSLNVKADKTVCIGDAPMDIIMSKNANLIAGIGVALGQTPYDKLLMETDYVLYDYSELAIM